MSSRTCRGRESNPYSPLKIPLWSKAFQLLLRPFLMPPAHCDEVARRTHPPHRASPDLVSPPPWRAIGGFPFGPLPSHGCPYGDASHGSTSLFDRMGSTHPCGRAAMAPGTALSPRAST